MYVSIAIMWLEKRLKLQVCAFLVKSYKVPLQRFWRATCWPQSRSLQISDPHWTTRNISAVKLIWNFLLSKGKWAKRLQRFCFKPLYSVTVHFYKISIFNLMVRLLRLGSYDWIYGPWRCSESPPDHMVTRAVTKILVFISSWLSSNRITTLQ